MEKLLLLKILPIHLRRFWPAVTMVAMLLLAGSVSVFALVNYVSYETETGSLSGNAQLVNDTSARGGSALLFSSSSGNVDPLGPPRSTPLRPASSFTKHSNLSFGPYGVSSLLDLYIPNSDGPYPLVIYIHGGGWRGYDKSECPTWISYSGFALACVNYRYSTEAPFPAQTIDNKAAVRWLRAHAASYNIWSSKIGAMGYSSGGHLASMLGVTKGVAQYDQGENLHKSSEIHAVYSGYGPMDLLDLIRVQPWHDSSYEIGPMLIGKPSISGYPTQARLASPTYYVDSADAPHLLHHGTADDVIAWQQSQLMHDTLTAAGVESSLELLPGAGHGTAEFGDNYYINQVINFYDTNLR